jgi:2'-5' RNA ligase
MKKTHSSAVVLIPPREVWEPIQVIRKAHDKQVRRWMPHITLLYPFAPKGSFGKILPELAQVGWEQKPFDLTLSRFRYFKHGRESYTLWLAPEPEAAVNTLHGALLRALPQFADTGSFQGGFSPHMSVGQVEGKAKLHRLVDELQATWQPLRFRVRELALISRREPPNDIFQVDQTIVLEG